MDEVSSKNFVSVIGKVIKERRFSHEMYGEKFYIYEIEVPRLSEESDILPITVSEKFLKNLDIEIDEYIIVKGQLRTYNKYENNSNKLLLTIFAKDLYIPRYEEYYKKIKNPNQIYLDGFICKKPIYRTTPFGREITDILIAVNRLYNKSDYIPTLAWGRNARFCDKLNVGDHIRCWGRIQSREYQKKLSNGDIKTKVAFEVSISKLEYIEDDNNKESTYRSQIN